MPERDSITLKPELALGVYRHYKGGEYDVLMLACHETNHTWLVVYQARYETGDYEDFMSTIEVDGRIIRRFTTVSP